MDRQYRVERKENGLWAAVTDWTSQYETGYEWYRREANALLRQNTVEPVTLRLSIQLDEDEVGQVREFVFYRGHSLNYSPNTLAWQPNDLVILDTDAKETACLMVVLGYTSAGRVQTRYLYDRVGGSPLHKRVMTYNLWDLHDPRRWPDKINMIAAQERVFRRRRNRGA